MNNTDSRVGRADTYIRLGPYMDMVTQRDLLYGHFDHRFRDMSLHNIDRALLAVIQYIVLSRAVRDGWGRWGLHEKVHQPVHSFHPVYPVRARSILSILQNIYHVHYRAVQWILQTFCENNVWNMSALGSASKYILSFTKHLWKIPSLIFYSKFQHELGPAEILWKSHSEVSIIIFTFCTNFCKKHWRRYI